MIDFRRTRITFESSQGVERTGSNYVYFPTTVLQAEAALNGFSISYNNGDHHLLTQKIDVRGVRLQGNYVYVDVNFLLRDNSGHIDDPYSGYVDVMVIADRNP